MRPISFSKRLTTSETPVNPIAPRVGAELELGFHDLLANGQAVGRAAGMVVFCFGPLPNERARVRVTAIKPKYAVARMLELLEASSDRAAPFCPVFGECGGCQVQHLRYEAQLAWKREVVRNALARIGGFVAVEVCEPIGMAEPRAYRNKMSLVVEQRSEKSQIGFYRQRSHQLVPIDGCPIVTPQLDGFIGKLNAARFEPSTTPAFAQARHIVARSSAASARSVVTITTEAPSAGVRASAHALLAALPGAAGLTNSYGLSSENAILGRKHRTLSGSPTVEERIGGLRYRISAGSFFQINVEIVGRIFAHLEPHLVQKRKLVDLYCGAGTFTLYFAQQGCDVVGVEEDAQAIGEASENAALNGLSERVTFCAGRVEDVVKSDRVRDALAGAEVVFLDPPRKGSDEVTLGAIAESRVPAVWYLSCDPATLARDLKFLAAKGYRLTNVQPFDMFPQTGHIETLVTLAHENPATRSTQPLAI